MSRPKVAPQLSRSLGGANPKGEVMEIIATLHGFGLGARTISQVLGYSERLMRCYMRDLGLPRHNPRTISRSIVDNLPSEVVQEADRIKARHSIRKGKAAQAMLNKVNGTSARTVHLIVDEGDREVLNTSRAGTSSEIPQIPSLAALLP